MADARFSSSIRQGTTFASVLVVLVGVFGVAGMALAGTAVSDHDFGALTGRSNVPTSSCTGGTISSTSSSNWGGYAAQTCLSDPAKDSVTFVQGSWTEPTVKCSGTSTSYAAFWVGIDGYSSSTVEQDGTDSDCDSGTPSYYAWYEMYPAAPVTLSLTISPGNTITASVQYTDSKFVLTVKDDTTGKSFSTSKSLKSADRNSAEWIDEAPSSNTVLPLADFGTVTFSSCTATIDGTTGGISASGWQAAEITMASSSTTKSSTSSLTSNDEGFTATWHHS